jgi:general secretion pathway protein H
MTERRARGFTLLEVVVVTAVIAIAAAIVLPRLGDRGTLAVEEAARRLADVAGAARERAILGGVPMRLVVDLDAGRFHAGRAGRDALTVLPASGDDPEPARLPGAVRMLAVARGGVPVTGGVVAIDLDPAGDALPVRIDLADARGHAASVVLPPAGARATVRRGAGG